MNRFDQFQLSQEILRGIQDLGFEEPSPIQAECIPAVLRGEDVIGQAQTGTGKTAAFGIPVLERINPAERVIQSVILAPTRELAIQVSEELRRIGRPKRVKTLPIYGGQSIGRQIKALQQGVHVVIGTPGRLLDHLRRGTINTEQVEMVVLDEADEMLDMGFIDDIENVFRFLPKNRQLLLFSATMPPTIRQLANKYMRKPRYITVNRGEVTVPVIKQYYYRVLENTKVEALCRILDSEEVDLSIIFCRTKKGVDELTESLQARGYLAGGLHGDLAQQQRDRVMNAFRGGEIELLVATDVAARGIDVGSVSHVINYDIPQDVESYVHRIGRTGRAGRNGVALTLVTPREMKQLRTIEEETGARLKARELPTLEEVAAKQQASWIAQIEEIIQSDADLTLFDELVDQLSGKFSAEKVAEAALYLAFSDRFVKNIDTTYNFGETGAAPGMVRFFINVGRNANLRPQELAKAISEHAGIALRQVGKINIYDRFSFVEVPEDVAPFVYEALRQSKINGARVNMEPARPRK
ncbi:MULTISPECIES: DEAD/DEAH box helicase [Thermoactinomyces]|jgi:ATP-dependent RNA helicase DeaD|uniref:ATP-dependent RNA helicase CshA n=1 Tax=Thermoactinomyces daqus TaxID=1329516 RepID=A0A7W1X902_9BACL|nr:MULTISPECIES: DEAD/DEAH box helicase [Thermoactinomyces]MBA4542246.1 DEAD/DEAH box helicase [Thermoactinomyces daqus]MBH8598302.1 DEAD/DEAH box helicase [Thermoactinomyces sp. CICC 10523]MBH8604425.1 DEAD/DEAH box helicase [Thermoactinomyces sp. CICC 10522]MBH8607574.1 DEAD/DEAH box helicase [Thermoactinomyces sp. CICC 10521]